MCSLLCFSHVSINAQSSSNPRNAPDVQRLNKLSEESHELQKKMFDKLAALREAYKTATPEETESLNKQYRTLQQEIEVEHTRGNSFSSARDDAYTGILKNRSIRFAGTDAMAGLMAKWYTLYRQTIEEDKLVGVPYELWYEIDGPNDGLDELISRKSDVAVYRDELSDEQRKQLAKAFPDPNKQPKEYTFGRAAMGFIVHESNLIRSLSLPDMEKMFRADVSNWKEVGHFNRPISRIGTAAPSLSWSLYIHQVMHGKRARFPEEKNRPKGPRVVHSDVLDREMKDRLSRFPGRGPFPRYEQRKVISEVAKDRNAIAYCLVPVKDIEGVRFIGIKNADGKAFTPTKENILMGDYPLDATFSFLVHPDASDVAKQYVEYLCGNQIVNYMNAIDLRPMNEAEQLLADKRLWDYEHGKGTPIKILGPDRQHDLLKALVLDYVTKEDVIRLDFKRHEAGKLQTSEIYVTDGTHPMLNLAEKAGGVFAASAVVPVVHVNNKVRSIGFKQVMNIFKGKKFQREGFVKGKSMNWHGLYANRPASEVFHQAVLPSHEYLMMKYSKDIDQGIVKTVKDEKSLTFFDYSSILQQQNDQIKVINIRTDDGIVNSDKKTIASGKYPIAKPLYIYLDTNASPEAKAFFKHLMAGGSNKTILEQGYVPVMNE